MLARRSAALQHAADFSLLQALGARSRLVVRAVCRVRARRRRRNTVNLTDGLDGLAISTFAVAAATYTALAYVTGHAVFADYLLLVHFEPIGELTIFCGALVGASLGFLWWNAHPADIFMGDVGSLALGGALGTVAILIKQELLLPIVGGVFVLEGAVGDHPGRVVQATRQARLPDGAAPSPLRTHRLERAEGHHAVPDPRRSSSRSSV